MSEVSDDLMQPGEMGDIKEPIGPKDFPGIETHFEPIAQENRQNRIQTARERLRLKKLLREKGHNATGVSKEEMEKLLGSDMTEALVLRPRPFNPDVTISKIAKPHRASKSIAPGAAIVPLENYQLDED